MLGLGRILETKLPLEGFELCCCADQAFIDASSSTHKTEDCTNLVAAYNTLESHLTKNTIPESPVERLLRRIFQVLAPWIPHVGRFWRLKVTARFLPYKVRS